MKLKTKDLVTGKEVTGGEVLVSFLEILLKILRSYVVIPLISYWWTSCVFYFGKVLGGYEFPDNYRVTVFLVVAVATLFSTKTKESDKKLSKILNKTK